MLQRRVSPAKKYLRRTLQVVALVGTLLIAILALALIVSQTPWFKDWLRKFAIRQASQYVNGTVSIGSLGGNLFFGIQLGDVAIDVNGERIVTLKQVEVKYSISELISQGVIVQQVRLDQPFVLLRRDASGWNVSRLVKRQEREANREGPRRSVSLPDIQIVDGRVAIDDERPSDAYRLPSRIDGLNAKGGFAYAPVHYSVTLDSLAFTGTAPDLTVEKLTGRFGTRQDDLNVEKLFLQTPQSSLTIDGVVRNYLSTPSLQVTASAPKFSLPEFAGVLPVLRGYDLHPVFDVKATGRQESLEMALNVKSEAGTVSGTVTADLKTPDLGVRGDVSLQNLDLAPILQSPARRSDITGSARVDLRMASHPPSSPALERLRGRVVFNGPRVVAEGYTASAVRLTADLAGRRISLDGRANAYGGSATARGFIVTAAAPGRPTQLDLAGSASHISLAALPRSLDVPRIITNLNATAYHVKGSIARTSTVEGSATLAQSTMAGGTILNGSSGTFSVAWTTRRRGLDRLEYAGRGEVKDLNLKNVGDAFQIAALQQPEYDSRINTTFDVKGSGDTADTARVDATGTATNSHVFGATLPKMEYEAHLAGNGLKGHAKGAFEHLDPARIAANPKYQGHLTGTVDAAFGIANLSDPITPDGIMADGRVTLTKSDVTGYPIDTADIEGQYENRRGMLRQATLKGPDLDVQASGPIALDESGHTNVKHHVAATNLATLGTLFGQEGLAGSAVVDGTLTGNQSKLTLTGTLDGANLGYQSNKALDLDSKYTVTVPNLDVAQVHVQAETSATFVQLGSFQIDTLTASTTYENRNVDFQAHVAQSPTGADAEAGAAASKPGERQMDAAGSVIFHPDHQEIHLPSLALRTNGIEWRLAAGTAAAIQYGSDQVQVQNVRLVNGNQVLQVDGGFSLGDNPQLSGIQVRAENVDISQAEKLALRTYGFTGLLNADAKIAGSAHLPEVSGHLAVQNGGFQQFKYESLTVDGSFANDRVGIDAKLVQTPGIALTAKGTIPMSAFQPNPPGVTGHVAAHGSDNIDLRVQSSRVDLAIVEGFTNEVTNVTGTVQADVRVSGSGEDPHFDGYVDIEGGAFGVRQAGVSFTGLTTRIELNPDRIQVPAFKILDQHGNALTIQGDLAVHERQAGSVNVSLKSDDFKILDNQLGNVHIQSDLRLTGEVRKPRIEGELRTDSARLEVDRILLQFSNPYAVEALPDVISAEQSTVSDRTTDQATRDALAQGRRMRSLNAPRRGAVFAPRTGILSALQLNVHFIAPDNLILRGNDLRPGGPTAARVGNINATVGADLQVTKEQAGALTIRGAVRTVRGFYEFQGRRFTIQRDGEVRFTGLPDLNPTINVLAERLIPNTGVTARIQVTGTARAPQIALSSTPPLDEADVLSLIVFNRSVNQLGTGERASLAETAGGIASGFVAQSLGRSIGKALDIDLFEITTSDVNTGETAGGVVLGKQVSDKAFVRFTQQFGQRSFMEFMLDYQLASFLRLNTTVSPETSGVANRLTQRRVERAGLDLIFFFSY